MNKQVQQPKRRKLTKLFFVFRVQIDPKTEENNQKKIKIQMKNNKKQWKAEGKKTTELSGGATEAGACPEEESR